jgi:hypothetical protein
MTSILMHSRCYIYHRSTILSKIIFRNIDRTVRNTDRTSLISGYTLYYQIMLHPMFDKSTIGMYTMSKLRLVMFEIPMINTKFQIS